MKIRSAWIKGIALILTATAATSVALVAAGQSFNTSIAPGYTQELFAATQLGEEDDFPFILGGVAFAPNGDVWSSECLFHSTVLHRFDAAATVAPSVHGTASLHPESAVVPTQGGCGLTNHRDGTLYSNSSQGVWKLDASTGAFIAGPLGLPGNALGITSDPSNGHVVYVGADCHPTLSFGSTTCTIYDLDPTTNVTTVFARVTTALDGPDHILGNADGIVGTADDAVGSQDDGITLIDGIYFDPSSNFLFAADRSAGYVGSEFRDFSRLTVFARPAALRPLAAPTDSTQIVRRVYMTDEPDGVAFHATGGFVVTLNESGGTMSKFQFPGGDYTQAPAASVFASGGFRGDLVNVGPDGCIYATQGRHASVADHGTRYDDGTETTEDSLVKICAAPGEERFQPGPGVVETVHAEPPTCSGVIGDRVWFDVNANGIQDAGEAGIDGATVVLTHGADQSTTTTGGGGIYHFSGLCAGSYMVQVAPPSGFDPAFPNAGSNPAIDSNGSPAIVDLAADDSTDDTIDFGYVKGSLAGYAYEDSNRNGMKEAGEPGLPGVTVSLGGTASTTTAADGSYNFAGLVAGAYQVTAPAVAAGLGLSTTNPLTVNLAAGQHSVNNNFGYVSGGLSGFAYRDVNRNGVRDAGEPGIPGVMMALSGASSGSVATAADGSYSYSHLVAATYTVTAPSTAANLALATASPLTVTLAAGQFSTDNNFGYVSGSIGGSAFQDVNQNGIFDAGEPGIGGVGITVSGTTGGSASTAASGDYVFPDLPGGDYSVAAPVTAGRFHLFTPSPLAVSLAPGAIVPHVDFGYVPVCIESTSVNNSNFNATPIAPGNVLWFNSNVKLFGLGTGTTHVFLDGATVQFVSNGIHYTLPVPSAMITISPTVTCATTTFNQAMNRWETVVPLSQANKDVFLAGVAFTVPAGFVSGINPVTWTAGSFSTDRPSVTANWKWSAAVYTSFSTNYNALGVKPAEGPTCLYANADHVGTPENFKPFVTGGARGGGGSNFTGSWSGTLALGPICQ